MTTVVVDYDPKSRKRVTIHAFLDTEQRDAEVCQKDLQREHPQREVVLIQAGSWETMKVKYRRYFPPR